MWQLWKSDSAPSPGFADAAYCGLLLFACLVTFLNSFCKVYIIVMYGHSNLCSVSLVVSSCFKFSWRQEGKQGGREGRNEKGRKGKKLKRKKTLPLFAHWLCVRALPNIWPGHLQFCLSLHLLLVQSLKASQRKKPHGFLRPFLSLGFPRPFLSIQFRACLSF